jgi:hypothetical protein
LNFLCAAISQVFEDQEVGRVTWRFERKRKLER